MLVGSVMSLYERTMISQSGFRVVRGHSGDAPWNCVVTLFLQLR